MTTQFSGLRLDAALDPLDALHDETFNGVHQVPARVIQTIFIVANGVRKTVDELDRGVERRVNDPGRVVTDGRDERHDSGRGSISDRRNPVVQPLQEGQNQVGSRCHQCRHVRRTGIDEPDDHIECGLRHLRR